MLFHSFVGAVFVQNGMETVQNWIGVLVDPEEYEPTGSTYDNEPYNAYKRMRTETMGSPTPPPPMQPPPPPMGPPPPLPASNPLAPAQPMAAFLPLFNQTANQRRLAVEYPAQFSGPAHAGRWTVQCVGTSSHILCARNMPIISCSQRYRERNRNWREQAACEGRGGTPGILCHGMGSS